MSRKSDMVWMIVIKKDSWLSKSHGAFTLDFLARRGGLGRPDPN